MKLELGALATPLGDVRFARSSGRLLGLAFAECWPAVGRALERRIGPIEWVCAGDCADLDARLRAYFAGELATLSGVEVELSGTDFQRRVWSALREIPAGETTSYGQLARRLGAAKAVRAVGAANGANPLWLVVPCHRAIGSDGSLTGYAGGVERKRWLLAHESKHSAHVLSGGSAQRAVQNSEKRPQSSGPSGEVPIFVPAGTATGLPASKR